MEEIFSTTRNLVKQYSELGQSGFLSALMGLRKEVRNLQKTRNVILDRFVEYRQLRRPRRSLIPLIGKALGYMFGTVSEEEFSVVESNVRRMAENQQEVVHVLDKSLSILNLTRTQVSENRHSLNALIRSVHAIDSNIANITEVLERRIVDIERFTQIYLRLDLVIGQLRRTTRDALLYLEHLNIQLDMLALGQCFSTFFASRPKMSTVI